MTDPKAPQPPQSLGIAPPRAERLPYERPAVISEEVFETMALSCSSSDPFSCPGGSDRS